MAKLRGVNEPHPPARAFSSHVRSSSCMPATFPEFRAQSCHAAAIHWSKSGGGRTWDSSREVSKRSYLGSECTCVSFGPVSPRIESGANSVRGTKSASG